MKQAYLWIWFWPDHAQHGGHINADLVFSSVEKFYELFGDHEGRTHQLVPIQVPAWFDDWDYIPDNY